MPSDNKCILFYFYTVRGGQEKRTLRKNSSHWRYETQFIHSSSTRNSKRLTTECFATSVNLPKWASSQIFAADFALNNSILCTSVLFHFYLFFLPVRRPNHCSSIKRLLYFFHIAPLVRTSLVGTGHNNREKQQEKAHSPHGNVSAKHLTGVAPPACACFSIKSLSLVKKSRLLFFCGTFHCPL